MKIAVLSDIHGNIQAFNNCLRFLEGEKVDKIFFLGDAIGYLPHGLEVLDVLISLNIECIMGNHEAMLLGMIAINSENEKVYGLNYYKDHVTSDQLNFIKSWPSSLNVELEHIKFLMVHGSPENHLTGYIYPDSNLSIFEGMSEDFVIVGHTHRPFISNGKGACIINVGSVGLPRDQGNLSGFLLIDTDLNRIEIIRIPFNVSSVYQQKVEGFVTHNSTIECLKRTNISPFGRIIK